MRYRRDYNWLRASPLYLKWNITFSIMHVIQPIDYIDWTQIFGSLLLRSLFVLHLFSTVIKNFAKEKFSMNLGIWGPWATWGISVWSQISYLSGLENLEIAGCCYRYHPLPGLRRGEVNLYPDFFTLFPTTSNTQLLYGYLVFLILGYFWPELDTAVIPVGVGETQWLSPSSQLLQTKQSQARTSEWSKVSESPLSEKHYEPLFLLQIHRSLKK